MADIPNVILGELIDPTSFGNAVVNRLNGIAKGQLTTVVKIGSPGAGTFVKADYPGLIAVKVMLQGSGGAGGGCGSTAANEGSAGGGGGGGGYVERIYTWSQLSASESFVVPAGGVGVNNAAGGDGSAATFSAGNGIAANGGAGGLSVGGVTFEYINALPGDGGAKNGTVHAEQSGQPGQAPSAVGQRNYGGTGGASHWGTGGTGGNAITAIGGNGSGGRNGGGGGGGANRPGQGSNRKGGNGGDGFIWFEIIILEEGQTA